jgi:hypothetical protein
MINSVIEKGRELHAPFFANNTTTGKRCMLTQRYEYLPLDYVKFQLIDYDKELMNNPNLTFSPVYKDAILKNYDAYFKGVKFSIYVSGTIYISGSIHKFYNDGIHNSNDFDVDAFKCVLRTFKDAFDISPYNLRIIGLEFGVNVNPSIKTDLILNNVLQHKRIDFENNINSRYGNYLQAKHSNYILKIYNKAKQYKLKDEILRIEIKQRNWSEYRKLGLNTLEDFIHYDKRIFVETLINKWDEVIFYNPLNVDNKWGQYRNVNFWRELKDKSNTTYSKHYKRLKVLNDNSNINIQENISQIILTKIIDLQGVTNYTFNDK